MRALSPLRLDRLSYLVKVPLALCMVSILSALGVFAVTYYLIAAHINAELLARVEQLSGALATSARGAIARDEIWDVYQQIAALVDRDSATQIIVVARDNTILVASDPVKYPLATSASTLPSALAAIAKQAVDANAAGRTSGLFSLNSGNADKAFISASQVLSEDGERLGAVIAYAAQDATLPKLRELLARLTSLGALALAVIVPLGWWLGRSLVDPLNRLRLAMTDIEAKSPLAERPESQRGTDEIAQLGQQFAVMRAEITRNQALESQMQAAERMALVGKLTASVAHEVNNPLGGMLNAISNLRLRGISDPFIEKTSSLLERGLRQIEESVAALMAQARREHTSLTAQDFDDLQLLAAPLASQRTIRVDWQVSLLEKDLNARSVPVRQIILNLVLNAIAAAHSQVAVRVEIIERNLRVVVRNDGVAFTVPAATSLAPEPDASGRLGLGLWVCFRLAQQLNGTLTIKAASDLNDAGGTVATLNIPLQLEVTNA